MTCTTVSFATGGTAIVCSRGPKPKKKRCACGKPADLACDWITKRSVKIGEGVTATKTCDAPICSDCAKSVGPNKDLCKRHAEQWAKHPKNPERVTEGAK